MNRKTTSLLIIQINDFQISKFDGPFVEMTMNFNRYSIEKYTHNNSYCIFFFFSRFWLPSELLTFLFAHLCNNKNNGNFKGCLLWHNAIQCKRIFKFNVDCNLLLEIIITIIDAWLSSHHLHNNNKWIISNYQSFFFSHKHP